MNQQQYDLAGLTEEQKEAFAHLLKKNARATYLLSIGDYPPNKIGEFRRANEQIKSTDSAARMRGEQYNRSLIASCYRE